MTGVLVFYVNVSVEIVLVKEGLQSLLENIAWRHANYVVSFLSPYEIQLFLNE